MRCVRQHLAEVSAMLHGFLYHLLTGSDRDLNMLEEVFSRLENLWLDALYARTCDYCLKDMRELIGFAVRAYRVPPPTVPLQPPFHV